MTQTYSQLGLVEVCLVPDAFRLESKRMQVAFVSRAPKWDMEYFSTGKKVVNRIPHDLWLNQGVLVMLESNNSMAATTLRYPKHVRMQGLNGIRYTMSLRKGPSPRLIDHSYCVVTADTGLSEAGQVTLNRIANMPPRPGGVYLASRTIVKKQAKIRLNKVERIPYDPAIFQVPAGYKEVTTQADVGVAVPFNMGDFMDALDLGNTRR
ncbi:MAG: hypothetical protein KC777_16765 [Cyanobacteria bacterium HKST-UBA02]|nr:hypothetical protein [Cyanobacteria bacterium HKST-UBA02]